MPKTKKKRCMILKFLIISLCLVLPFLILAAYAHWIEPNLLTVSSITIKTEKEIIPCRIIFFTDTHFGKFYDEAHIERIVEKINLKNADLVIFGGDLLDNYARDRDDLDLEYLKDEMAKIKANTGKYAVWGNHDYGGGAVRIYEDFMTSCGFQVLKNESRMLEPYGIKILGYDDYLMGWTDPSFYQIDSGIFHVIVTHEPAVSQQIENNSENFLLSGHTHGGQVTIPFLTKNLLPKGSGRFVKGLYTEKNIKELEALQMYTSSGIGMTRYPFRFMNVPEIIEVNLRMAD